LKAIVSIRNVRFDINILVIIAGNFFICINSFS
jgi:hypothetical protein